jgi:hypothetical protein
LKGKAMLEFMKSSDFARFVVYALTAAGVTFDPAQIEIIVAGGFALSALIHAVRAGMKARKSA